MQGDGGSLMRRQLRCRGVVQGVGFRPAVFRLASALGLGGFVQNDIDGACIEVQGPSDLVSAFERRLPCELPPLAQLAHVEATTVEPLAEADGFAVVATATGRRGDALVPADAAICAACRAEVDDPADRRHRHPFATCTDCGPRFSIVRELPYDRERTSMASFRLCPRCAVEYADPSSRRYHAESICCPDCGPQVRIVDVRGTALATGAGALDGARRLLTGGGIVAVQGLGGFQLLCRADDAAVVSRLRRGKARPAKPFALMARDLDCARRLVHLDAADEKVLTSSSAPILLAPRRATAEVAEVVAPGVDDLGVMLPTTPLHRELFRGAVWSVLVATSGNRGDEPICIDGDEARRCLRNLADAFVVHERAIVRRVDDSVVRSTADGPMVVRRSRGYVPVPVRLPVAAPVPVLALGGQQQVTACVGLLDEAFLSQHVGDLGDEPARAFLREVVGGLEDFLAVESAVVAVDTHPDYVSAHWGAELAAQRGAELLAVPHHLAHAAAVLGEHLLWPAPGERSMALVLDGTGHGVDDRAWGAELLAVDGTLRWSRIAHGSGLPLVGGSIAVGQPWRVATATLARAGFGDRLAELPMVAAVGRERLRAVAGLAVDDGWPLAHGCGRLFEAAGALLGLATANSYEGEAAVRLEALASRWPEPVEAWPEVGLGPAAVVPHDELLVAVAERCLRREPPASIAAGLHATCAALWAQLVRRELPDCRAIALGGGCLVNRLLRRELSRSLAAHGCPAVLPFVVPPGDGGLAYGQTVVAAAAVAHAVRPVFVPRGERPTSITEV